ncbi:hypothetical protein A4U53_026175 [Rhizobium ruizarguesonis]|uniref:Uncharacterized protein n=1 Tax=Rhizobium ruizarguesonis TaxID=2081791 RepID=A0ACD5EKF0_9HYPH
MDESGFSPARRNRCGNQTMNQQPLFDESFESPAAAFSKVESGGSEVESASQRSEFGQSFIHLKFQ